MDDNFMEDWYFEWYIERLFVESENKRLAKKGIWVDKEGNKLEISKMSTPHIKNCINFINKNDLEERMCYLEVFKEELNRREIMQKTIDSFKHKNK